LEVYEVRGFTEGHGSFLNYFVIPILVSLSQAKTETESKQDITAYYFRSKDPLALSFTAIF
jgi:hypothetical protein